MNEMKAAEVNADPTPNGKARAKRARKTNTGKTLAMTP